MESISLLLADLQQASNNVHLPNEEAYNASNGSYFSQQEESIRPAAVALPQTTQEVANIVKVIAKHQRIHSTATPFFAIRSGGKAPQGGWANVEGGVTIDLGALNHVIPAADRKTVKVGGGARWGDVYKVLDPLKLGISGGRDATVGVGGLTLGGGISFFGPQRGFVCDDVESFEVVLAEGDIVQASQSSHADLWRALKGGSSNFGIVTTFTFRSFELGDIWGGQNVYPVDTASKHLDALHEFTANSDPDPHATIIQSFAIYQGNVIINEGLKYTKPVADPPVFRAFLEIPGCIHSTNRLLSMTEAAKEQSGFNVNGRRQALVTTSFVNNREVLQHAFDTWKATVPCIQQDYPWVNWSMTLQPMPRCITQKGIELGGNVLGLEGAPNLINAQVAVSWDDDKDDHALLDKALGIMAAVDEFSKKKGAYHRYLYLNYCWSTQDPMSSYGQENVKLMQEVSEKYDAAGLFRSGLAGGFRLGAPQQPQS